MNGTMTDFLDQHMMIRSNNNIIKVKDLKAVRKHSELAKIINEIKPPKTSQTNKRGCLDLFDKFQNTDAYQTSLSTLIHR